MRDKTTATAFAFFLGWMGIHQFYLGRIWQGVLYLLFSWTLIPLALSFIDFLILVLMSDKRFNEKYNYNLKQLSPVYHNKSQIKTNASTSNYQNRNNFKSVSTNNIIDVNHPPNWTGGYVYSFKDIRKVDKAQQEFYYAFKQAFFNKNYVGLGNNRGYAFLLLFDLLEEHEHKRNYYKLLHNLEILVEKYPFTKYYAANELAKLKSSDKTVISISEDALVKIDASFDKLTNEYLKIDRSEPRYSNPLNQYEWDYDYWKLGNQYKEKLNLNKEQEKTLNRLYNVINAFNDIEFFKEQNLKFFLLNIKELENHFLESGQNLKSVLEEIVDLKIKKQYGYRKGSTNYKYTFDYEYDEVYRNIFRINENYLREWFQHKRKLNVELNISDSTLLEKYNNLLELLSSIFDKNSNNIEKPDKDAEIQLNSLNTTRWKFHFERIVKEFKNDLLDYKDKIDNLAELNKKNPSLENIYYEASKFIAKHDKLLSLEYYVKYVDADLKSSTVNNKKFNQTVQKVLFKNQEQINQFESIVNNFIADRNLEKALEQLQSIYQIKRKKIELNVETIHEVKSQLSDTVVLLNEYLEEEDEITSNQEDETISLNFNQVIPNSVLIASNYLVELELNEIQIELLELFNRYELNIHKDEVQEFVSKHNLFLESLIDGINEKCYEVLDDTLIEEEDETFTIYEEYYKTISVK